MLYTLGIVCSLSYVLEGATYNFFRREASKGSNLAGFLLHAAKSIFPSTARSSVGPSETRKIPFLPQIPNLNPTAPGPPPFLSPGKVLLRPPRQWSVIIACFGASEIIDQNAQGCVATAVMIQISISQLLSTAGLSISFSI